MGGYFEIPGCAPKSDCVLIREMGVRGTHLKILEIIDKFNNFFIIRVN